VAALSEHADAIAKVTILPAGRALGVTEQLPEDERRIYPESYLRDQLAIHLGGRAAERLLLDETSSGASNDLAGATQVATRMVREFGMSERLGPIGFADEGPQYLGPQRILARPYAEDTQRVIDEEVAQLLNEADARAASLLKGHRDGLERVVASLLEHESIDGDDVVAALGPTIRLPDPSDERMLT
jgi:cell division protease FtsH